MGTMSGVLFPYSVSAACFPSWGRQTVVPQSTQALLLAGLRHENQATFFTTRSATPYSHVHPRR
jgi:hypothetical protein